jgi:hypothetical protein
MPELTKETTTSVTTTKWYSSLLTPQTFVLAMSGLIAVTLFWFKTEDNWKKTATKADLEDVKILEQRLKDLEERVTRQYTVSRESNEKVEAKTEQVIYWQRQWDGYWKGLNEKK